MLIKIQNNLKIKVKLIKKFWRCKRNLNDATEFNGFFFSNWNVI